MTTKETIGQWMFITGAILDGGILIGAEPIKLLLPTYAIVLLIVLGIALYAIGYRLFLKIN